MFMPFLTQKINRKIKLAGRRSHRLFLIFKSLNGLIDWNFNFNHIKDVHDCNTRFNNNICKDLCRVSLKTPVKKKRSYLLLLNELLLSFLIVFQRQCQ